MPALKSDCNTKRVSDDKFFKKNLILYGSGSGNEKHEKRTRNKDRPDRAVWAPLHRSDVSQASEERLIPSLLQSAQTSHNSMEGISAYAHGYVVFACLVSLCQVV